MKKIKYFLGMLCATICLSIFSFSPVNKTIERNKNDLEELITSLVLSETNDCINAKRLKNDNSDIVIDNLDEMQGIIDDSNIDFASLMNNILTNMFEVNENSADIKIDESSINILDFDYFDFKANDATSNEVSLNAKMLNPLRAANNSVSFTGININPETCRWVSDKFMGFADKMVHHYSGPVGIVYTALKLSAPAFVAQFTSIIANVINQFTDWLAAIGPWGVVIKLVLIVFSGIAAVIIAHIIWAGANKKGLKMGLEWYGWFKARWVYNFYD